MLPHRHDVKSCNNTMANELASSASIHDCIIPDDNLLEGNSHFQEYIRQLNSEIGGLRNDNIHLTQTNNILKIKVEKLKNKTDQLSWDVTALGEENNSLRYQLEELAMSHEKLKNDNIDITEERDFFWVTRHHRWDEESKQADGDDEISKILFRDIRESFKEKLREANSEQMKLELNNQVVTHQRDKFISKCESLKKTIEEIERRNAEVTKAIRDKDEEKMELMNETIEMRRYSNKIKCEKDDMQVRLNEIRSMHKNEERQHELWKRISQEKTEHHDHQRSARMSRRTSAPSADAGRFLSRLDTGVSFSRQLSLSELSSNSVLEKHVDNQFSGGNLKQSVRFCTENVSAQNIDNATETEVDGNLLQKTDLRPGETENDEDRPILARPWRSERTSEKANNKPAMKRVRSEASNDGKKSLFGKVFQTVSRGNPSVQDLRASKFDFSASSQKGNSEVNDKIAFRRFWPPERRRPLWKPEAVVKQPPVDPVVSDSTQQHTVGRSRIKPAVKRFWSSERRSSDGIITTNSSHHAVLENHSQNLSPEAPSLEASSAILRNNGIVENGTPQRDSQNAYCAVSESAQNKVVNSETGDCPPRRQSWCSEKLSPGTFVVGDGVKDTALEQKSQNISSEVTGLEAPAGILRTNAIVENVTPQVEFQNVQVVAPESGQTTVGTSRTNDKSTMRRFWSSERTARNNEEVDSTRRSRNINIEAQGLESSSGCLTNNGEHPLGRFWSSARRPAMKHMLRL